MFAGKKSAQIREILISESAWEEMTCLFAPSLVHRILIVECFDVLTYPDCKFRWPKAMDSDGYKNLFASTCITFKQRHSDPTRVMWTRP